MPANDLATTDSLAAGNRRCLRVGVILDSLVVPLWIERVLDQIDRASFAELTVVVMIKSRGHLPRDWCSRFGSLLFRRWRQLDQLVFRNRSARPEAFDLTPIEFHHCDPLILNVESDVDNGESFPSGDRETLKSLGVDVILDFVSKIPTQEIIETAQYGVLRFEDAQESLASLYQLLRSGDPVLTHELEVASVPSPSVKVFRSYSALDRISLFRNHSNLCWKRSDTVIRSLKDLYRNGGWADDTVDVAVTRHKPLPGNTDILRIIPQLLWYLARGQVTKRLLREHWFVAFRNRPEKSIELCPPFRLLHPPRGHFYADPFLIERNGKAYIFFEDYSFEKGKANISFVELDSNGHCSRPRVALEEKYHLAYPDVFEWQGEFYMIPETKNNRTIQLYRATDFPQGWQMEQELLRDVSGVDSTIFHHDGKFWLFTAGLGSIDPWFDGDSELFLFVSDSLGGPWMPHPKNPIVSDVRRSRPAGQLFLWDGQLIRPAQDCSIVYGYAVCFNRVDTISVNDYRETPIGSIGPGWMAGNRGTHTYNRSEHYEVLDGRTLVARFCCGEPRPVLRTIPARQPVASCPGELL